MSTAFKLTEQKAESLAERANEIKGVLSELALEIHVVRERQERALSEVCSEIGEPGGWDAESAEALMRLHEADAGKGFIDPRPQSRNDDEAPELPSADLAAKIALALSDIMQKPNGVVLELADRLRDLETELSNALADVVRRSDLEGLKAIGAQISELSGKLDLVQNEVQRLDGIESSMCHLVEQVSEERLKTLLAKNGKFAAELEAVAAMAADRTRARFAEELHEAMSVEADRYQELRSLIERSIVEWRVGQAAQSAIDPAGISELRTLIESTEDQRRTQDQQTISTLETVQDALVRVLDRMDVIEDSIAQVAVPASEEDLRRHQVPALAHTASKVDAGHDAGTSARAPKLKRDLAAEAGRAKAKATAEAAQSNSKASSPSPTPTPSSQLLLTQINRSPIADAHNAPSQAGTTATTEQPQTAFAGFGVIPEAVDRADAETEADLDADSAMDEAPRRFITPGRLAAALAVIVAINGALLMLSRRQPDLPPIAIEPAGIEQVEPGLASDGAASAATATGTIDQAPSSSTATPEPQSEHVPADTTGSSQDTGSNAVELGMQSEGASVGEAAEQSVAGVTLPPGLAIEKSEGSNEEAIALSYHQQIAADLSQALGQAAAGAPTGALMPEAQSQAMPEAKAEQPADGNDDASSKNSSLSPPSQADTGRVSQLDLPPATVGPLSMRLAAANGDPSAEFEVASRLAEGKGTDQNFAESVRWYQRSAAQGFTQAHYRLGTLFERGLGVKKDMARARVWYQRAAEAGNVKAMHNLAVMIAGPNSNSEEFTQAAKWFERAAEYGLPDSQYNLAVLYENGLGVTASSVVAYKWYSLAAKSGDKDAKTRLEAMTRTLSEAELKSAGEMIASFKPRVADAMANDPRAAGEAWKKRALEQPAGAPAAAPAAASPKAEEANAASATLIKAPGPTE